jgi:dTMP kinase
MTPKQHPNGFLLAIEGIDGAGKSTQVARVAEELRKQGYDVVTTREPTPGKWGQLLRDSALKGRLSPKDELDAFVADRREHVESLIKPSLQAGKVVVIDRYYFSTVAYQGARDVLPVDELLAMNEAFAPPPDLLILLDVDPAGGLGRVGSRGDKANYFENLEALVKCRSIFLGLRKPYLRVIDASQPANEVTQRIMGEFAAVMLERKAGSAG